jgi:predicted CoA-substrate-specific enzyme activase
MSATIGIDLGAISVQIVVLGDPDERDLFTSLQGKAPFISFTDNTSLPILVTPYTRIRGNPAKTTLKLLQQIAAVLKETNISGIRACGSGDGLISHYIKTNTTNEFTAIAKGVEFLHPNVHTVFEMGGANSRYLFLEKNLESGKLGLMDYNKSGDCAAGTGAFLDQQAARMKYKIEDIGDLVADCAVSAKIAGRCSVFAKSDMIHAQQKGYKPAEILKGLCEAVGKNFKSNIVCGKAVQPPVAFIGGVAANRGVVQALRMLFDCNENELFVPASYYWISALGAALLEFETADRQQKHQLSSFFKDPGNGSAREAKKNKFNERLSLNNVVLLQNRVMQLNKHNGNGRIKAFLGIDIGSVSTNLAVIDSEGNVLDSIYTRTLGRPIEVVDHSLHRIEKNIGKRITICGVGTTGSGRELIGTLIGADTINDEITAHKTGADFIGKKMLNKSVDTIFEIGGQDSKYISLKDGIVIDFAMNEACAAGTGSFLEERAEELEISIKDQFASLSLNSQAPIRLGERCTVFMERDVTAYQQTGASKEDLTAGLAYSVVYNYLNRVVGPRKIGDVIFFQGGTAYNQAVAAAFSLVLNKEIIVPPYNGVMGAIGVALLAKHKHEQVGYQTTFRGYSLKKVNYTQREFVCKSCTNHCDIQAFTVGGETTYWGDQCSEKYRKRAKNSSQASIEDLFEVRKKMLFNGYDPKETIAGKNGKTIGIPLSMYTYDWLPFWITFLRELDFQIVVSAPTDKKIKQSGVESAVAEPCFPITISHGHVLALFQQGADFVLLPNMINLIPVHNKTNAYFCPWGQTLPFVVSHSPHLEKYQDRILKPTMEFGYGLDVVGKSLSETVRPFGVSKRRALSAFNKAYDRQTGFRKDLQAYGRTILDKLNASGEKAIILVGRPYNIYDSGVNLDIPKKMRNYYGINLIPFDFLETDHIDIRDITDNMFWNYGRKIIAVARSIRENPNLDLIYITNFKCGPDSYIKHYISDALGRPFLVLQFDEHSNDAGYLTRCEAYLTSKGFI